MNSEWFKKVVKDQIKMCEDVLINKAKEYSDDSDRLHNFKNAAGMMGCDNKEALAGMMAKHTISIYDMCRSGKDYSIELWDEKITDHINYLLLLKAVVAEEKHGIKIPSIPVFGTYYGLMLEKAQKDPHVKYEAAPGMTLMGNQFDSDEDAPKPKFDPEDLNKAIENVRKHIENCSLGNCGTCPHSILNGGSERCGKGFLAEYDNLIARLKAAVAEGKANTAKISWDERAAAINAMKVEEAKKRIQELEQRVNMFDGAEV